MNKTNLLLTVSVILLLLCVVLIVVYWDVLFVPYTPSISQIHKQNCAYLNDVLDEIGVSEDSPYRKNCVGELNACPKTLRPTKGPDGKWVCPGDSKLTTSRNGDPCCMVPPPLENPDEDSAGKKVEDFVKDNKIIIAQFTADMMNGLMNWMTKKNIKNPKAFMKDKIEGIRNTLKEMSEGAGKGATKEASDKAISEATENSIKEAGEEAARKSAESGANEAAQREAREAAETEAREKLGQAVEEAATRAAEASAEKAGGELFADVIDQVAVETVAAAAAEVASKLALILMNVASAVGAMLGFLMSAGMALDALDIGGYRQFMDNQYTYAHMRNSIEGATIVAMKQAGLKIPSYFNLANLGNKVMGIQNYEDGVGLIFNRIYTCYYEATQIHHTQIMQKSLEKLHSDDKVLDVMFEKIFDANQGKVDITDTIKNKFKELFHENAVDRDKFLYQYMQTHLFYRYPEYKKYIMVDYDMSDADVYGITLSEEGIALWNQFVIDTHHASVMGRVIYSKYYRDIPDITDPKYVRDGQENDPSSHKGESDFRGSKVYNLVTMKIKDRKGVEKKWTQVSASANIIKTKCEKGMHLPSLAYLLSNMADEKICKWTQKPKCEGTADKDGKKCALNKSESNCASTNEDGSPTGDCVFSGWIPSQCIIDGYPSDEFAMNRLECQMNNGTYYASQCGTRKSSYIDAHASNYSQAILQKTTCSDGLDDPNCKEFTATSLVTGVAAKAAPKLFVEFEAAKILGDIDVSPDSFGVTYNEDTGVCNMTKDWCRRMELDYFEKKGHDGLVDQEQMFTNCTESDLQEDLEMILGKNVVRLFRLAGDTVGDCVIKFWEHDNGCKGDIKNIGDTLGNFFENAADNVEEVGKDLVHDVEDVAEDVGDAFSHAWKSFISIF